MRLDPLLPWDTLLNRVLQSWRDRAPRSAHWAQFNSALPCETCQSDVYLHIAMAHDQQSAEWPDWMKHELHDGLLDLRTELLLALFERPHHDGTIADYYRGSALIPVKRQSQGVREAVRIVDDHGKVFDLWMRDRMEQISPWPERVRQAASRSALLR